MGRKLNRTADEVVQKNLKRLRNRLAEMLLKVTPVRGKTALMHGQSRVWTLN
jgi:hypothetical protein